MRLSMLWRFANPVLAAALFLFFLGCASSNFKKARELDTVSAYDAFLARYGDSQYAAEAMERRQTSAYRIARYLDTVSAYERFLREYPIGPLADSARKEVGRINAEVAMESAIVSSVRRSSSAIDQALILAHASGSLKERLSRNTFLRPYLVIMDRLILTRRDVVVTFKKTDCQSAPILGTLCTDYFYAGKILRDDIVYIESGARRIRTLHQERDLLKMVTDSGGYDLRGWSDLVGKEAFGETQSFKAEQHLEDYDLFHHNFNVRLSQSFYPTRYAGKSTSASGGILGFIQDHPVASLIIGAAVASAIDQHAKSSRSEEGTEPARAVSSGPGRLGRLLSCASQAVAGKLIENPAAAGAISEAIRAGLEDSSYSLRGASIGAATNYVVGKLRSSGHEDAAKLVETGDFLLCAIGH